MSIPVRLYPVYVGAAVDDPDRRCLITCRSEAVAQRIAMLLEDCKRTGGLALDDCGEQYFHTPLDTEIVLDVGTVNEAIALGFTVRSVVLPNADVPEDKVLAKIAGSAVEAPPPVAPPSDPPVG